MWTCSCSSTSLGQLLSLLGLGVGLLAVSSLSCMQRRICLIQAALLQLTEGLRLLAVSSRSGDGGSTPLLAPGSPHDIVDALDDLRIQRGLLLVILWSYLRFLGRDRSCCQSPSLRIPAATAMSRRCSVDLCLS